MGRRGWRMNNSGVRNMADNVMNFLSGLNPNDTLVIARQRGDGKMVLLEHNLTPIAAGAIINLIQAAILREAPPTVGA